MVSAQRMKQFSELSNVLTTKDNVTAHPTVQDKQPTLKIETDDDIIAGQQIYFIKLSRISRFEGQPRRYFDEKALQLLSESLENGQNQPCVVCPDPNVKGHFVLIGGERRWRAFHLIWTRTGREPLLKAIIDTVKNPGDHFYKAVVDNLLREDLSPVDEAAQLYQLYSQGKTIAALAKMIGKSVSYVDGYLKLHTLGDQIKELMNPDRPKHKRLSITTAIQIARSTKNADLRLEIAKEAVERELGLRESRFLIEKKTGFNFHKSNGTNQIGFIESPDIIYRSLKITLTRNTTVLEKYSKQDISRLYHYRDDEFADRERDVKVIDNLILLLQTIKEKIQE